MSDALSLQLMQEVMRMNTTLAGYEQLVKEMIESHGKDQEKIEKIEEMQQKLSGQIRGFLEGMKMGQGGINLNMQVGGDAAVAENGDANVKK